MQSPPTAQGQPQNPLKCVFLNFSPAFIKERGCIVASVRLGSNKQDILLPLVFNVSATAKAPTMPLESAGERESVFTYVRERERERAAATETKVPGEFAAFVPERWRERRGQINNCARAQKSVMYMQWFFPWKATDSGVIDG